TAYEVVCWRVSADGRFVNDTPLIAGAGTGVPAGSAPPYNLCLAGSGRAVLAVWQQTYGLKGALIKLTDDYVFTQTISTNAWSHAAPAVAANNREFFILWRSFDASREGIAAMRLDLNGKPISQEWI